MGLAEMGTPSLGQKPGRAEFGQIDGVDVYAQCSVDQTGGDLFDHVRVGPRVAFLLSDIAGRRPELDPISARMQSVFRATSTALFSADKVNLMEAAETLILAINHGLIEIANGVRFAPTMIGCYDVQLGILAYINAGGQTALFRDSDGTRPLPNVSMPLGLFTHLTYDASIQAFEPGALLVVVTKGVTESLGSKNPSDTDSLMEIVQQSTAKSASAICDAVLKAAQRLKHRRWEWVPFRGEPVQEDMTAFAMVRTV